MLAIQGLINAISILKHIMTDRDKQPSYVVIWEVQGNRIVILWEDIKIEIAILALQTYMSFLLGIATIDRIPDRSIIRLRRTTFRVAAQLIRSCPGCVRIQRKESRTSISSTRRCDI